jgi:hypothetical protein
MAAGMTATPVVVISPLWVLPLWAIFLIVLVTLMIGHEAGVQLSRRVRGDGRDGSSDDGIGGNYLPASLALLALLVAFSFSMAVDRYNSRRALVNEEANAISTSYRWLLTLEEPGRTKLIRMLRPYVEARVAFSQADTHERLRRAEMRTDMLRVQYWPAILKMVDAHDPMVRPVLDSTNDMFVVAASRRASIEAVIPHAVLIALLLYATIAAIFMGYSHSLQRRYFLASTIQFVLLAMAVGLIVDLDRPRTGFVEVSQAPLYRAAAPILNAEPAALPAPAATGVSDR